MAKPQVTVTVDANAVGFHRTMQGAKKELKAFTDMSHGLKGALMGALGGLTLGAIVDHMTDFAKSLEDVSKNLGVSIERAYELKKAALEAGKELGAFEKPKAAISKFMVGLAGGKNRIAAQELGIQGNESWDAALVKALTASRGKGRNWEPFTKFAGQKAEWMLDPSTRESIIKRGGSGLDVGAAHELARLKLEFELMTMELQKGLLPALAEAARALLGFAGWVGQKAANYGARTGAHEAAMAATGETKKFGSTAPVEAAARALIPGYNTFASKKYKAAYEANLNATMKDLAAENVRLEQAKKTRRDNFDKEQSELDKGITDWEPDTDKKGARQLASNPFLKLVV